MSQFTDRQKSFENKFKNDEEFNFKVNARRNKLLGLWAAGMLSLEGEEAEAVRADRSMCCVVHSNKDDRKKTATDALGKTAMML